MFLIAFWAWVLLRLGRTGHLRGMDGDELRAHYGREAAWWGLWSAVAIGITTWVAVTADHRPALLVTCFHCRCSCSPSSCAPGPTAWRPGRRS